MGRTGKLGSIYTLFQDANLIIVPFKQPNLATFVVMYLELFVVKPDVNKHFKLPESIILV